MITIQELRGLAADRADIRDFQGVLADLTKEDRETIIDNMAIIVNETPEDYSVALREFAAKRIESKFFQKPFDEFTASDALKTFGGEFASQGKQILTLQGGTIKTAILLAAIAFGASLAFKARR
jgi:hypothetical protein